MGENASEVGMSSDYTCPALCPLSPRGNHRSASVSFRDWLWWTWPHAVWKLLCPLVAQKHPRVCFGINCRQNFNNIVPFLLNCIILQFLWYPGFAGGSVVKNPPTHAGGLDLILGLGRSPGGGIGSPLQYSWLGNPMDRGAWCSTVLGVTKESDTT